MEVNALLGHNNKAFPLKRKSWSGNPAEGDSTIAVDNASHAEGTDTIASGTSSHAEGNLTTAIGLLSCALLPHNY